MSSSEVKDVSFNGRRWLRLRLILVDSGASGSSSTGRLWRGRSVPASDKRSAREAVTAPAKLPAADKIVEAYLKAIGGKKRVAAIRDATFEWAVHVDDHAVSGQHARGFARLRRFIRK